MQNFLILGLVIMVAVLIVAGDMIFRQRRRIIDLETMISSRRQYDAQMMKQSLAMQRKLEDMTSINNLLSERERLLKAKLDRVAPRVHLNNTRGN